MSARDNDFKIGQGNQDEQTEGRDNMISGGTSSDNASNPTQINYPHVDVHTLEANMVSWVQSKVESVMTSVERSVQDAVLPAIEKIIILWKKMALKSAYAPSDGSVDGNVLEPDQKEFSSNIESLRMTTCSRINSHMDLNWIDETPGNITVEEVDLFVNERNIDRQTNAHHSDLAGWGHPRWKHVWNRVCELVVFVFIPIPW